MGHKLNLKSDDRSHYLYMSVRQMAYVQIVSVQHSLD